MLSRVADSIYWMNRYVERAENIARFIDVNLTLLLDSPIGVSQQWKPLILTTGDLPIFEERYGEANADNVIRFLTFDRTYPNSILVFMPREKMLDRCVKSFPQKCGSKSMRFITSSMMRLTRIHSISKRFLVK